MCCCDCVLLWWCVVVTVYCCDCVLLWLCIVVIVKCCGDVLLWLRIVVMMYCCDCVLLWWCIVVIMYCCDCVLLWWCIVVMMYCCGDVWLWLCNVVVMYCCGDVLLWWGIVVMMYCCGDVLLWLCIVVMMYCNITIRICAFSFQGPLTFSNTRQRHHLDIYKASFHKGSAFRCFQIETSSSDTSGTLKLKLLDLLLKLLKPSICASHPSTVGPFFGTICSWDCAWQSAMCWVRQHHVATSRHVQILDANNLQGSLLRKGCQNCQNPKLLGQSLIQEQWHRKPQPICGCVWGLGCSTNKGAVAHTTNHISTTPLAQDSARTALSRSIRIEVGLHGRDMWVYRV